jgi:hypothetical protein
MKRRTWKLARSLVVSVGLVLALLVAVQSPAAAAQNAYLLKTQF